MIDVDREEMFRELVTDGRPVVVDFYADWCGPCRDMKPVLRRVSRELSGDLAFAKLNIDEFPDLAKRAGVTSVPTLVVFKGGRAVARHRGFRPDEVLRAELSGHALEGAWSGSPEYAESKRPGLASRVLRFLRG